MPTFLDNSLNGLNRGWQQLYGQQAARRARPQGQLFRPTPVAQNPAMGAPVGIDDPNVYNEYYTPQDNTQSVESPVFPGTQNYPVGAGNARVYDIQPTQRPPALVPGQGLQYGGTTVVQNAPTLRQSVQQLQQPGMRSVPTPTPESALPEPVRYPVPVPTPESDVGARPTQPATAAHPATAQGAAAVAHAAARHAAAQAPRQAQPAQVNYWQGNPTMQQVGPQVQQGPSPNIFQRAWQSLGHLFGAPRTGTSGGTTAGGPGSQGHPFYGTPYAYGTPEYAQYWDTHWGAHVPRATLVTPTSHNPEQGQTLSGDDSSDGSGTGLLSRQNPPNWFQNFMKNLFGTASGEGQPGPTDISQNPEVGQPISAYDIPQGSVFATPESTYSQGLDQLGGANEWPTGSIVVPGQYVMGPAQGNNPGEILATGADATQTPGGGGGMGGMSGGQMGASAIGAIGSGISNIGKNISNTKATYTAPNIPLPQRAQFVPPTLAPNRNVSY